MLVAFIFLVLYLLMLLFMMVAWYQIPTVKDKSEKQFKVSVVIPFRNELAHLEQLVKDLERQTHTDFEVLFVNDHSTDQGAELLSSILKKHYFHARLLHLREKEGKKMALAQGIDSASGEIIVTTDADCRFSEKWLEALVQPFCDEKVLMVAGPVYLSGSSLWQRMQSIEFSALMGVGGAMIHFKKPTMANGANLAYRKSTFHAVKGFENISDTPSGDDELLMDKFKRYQRGSIVFIKQREAWVKTQALPTFQEFHHQRLRWAGKWRVRKRGNTMVTAFFIFLMQAIQLYLVYVLINSWMEWKGITSGVFILLRAMMEYHLIRRVRKSHDGSTSSWVFTACYLIYPLYVLYFGIASNIKQFEWKGRVYDR